jgi:hypothetical protein
MIVNEKYGFAYTHLQKCGGNTLKKYLLNIEGSKYVVPKEGYCHSCVSDMPQYKDLFNFATIRNPFTWYMSMYYFSKRANNQEGDIFGDVNKIPFTEWLHNVLDPKPFIRKTDKWRTEIGFEVPKEIITEGTLDVGWWSYRFLYGVSSIHKEVFISGENYDLIKYYNSIIDVDCLINMEKMDLFILGILNENTKYKGTSSLNTYKRENTTNYNRDIEAHYTDADIALVMEKDSLFFQHHYGGPINIDTLPAIWYRS